MTSCGKPGQISHIVRRVDGNPELSGIASSRGGTNRPVDFRGMTWLTFRNGVIVEGWDSWNLGRLLESLRQTK